MELGWFSEEPGDLWKMGSGVAEPEWVVRSMLLVAGVLRVGLDSLAVELAGRRTGQ